MLLTTTLRRPSRVRVRLASVCKYLWRGPPPVSSLRFVPFNIFIRDPNEDTKAHSATQAKQLAQAGGTDHARSVQRWAETTRAPAECAFLHLGFQFLFQVSHPRAEGWFIAGRVETRGAIWSLRCLSSSVSSVCTSHLFENLP